METINEETDGKDSPGETPDNGSDVKAQIKKEDLDRGEIFNKFSELGCCTICCIRFIGETEAGAYRNVSETLKKWGLAHDEDEKNEKSAKILKSNPCIACLGVLQKPSCDIIMQKVLDDIISAAYDSDTFKVAITLPVAFQVRAHALYVYLEETFPACVERLFPHGCVTVGVKDVWKWLFPPLVEASLGKAYDADMSDLFIGINIVYEDNDKECASLLKMIPSLVRKKRLQRLHPEQEVYSRKGVEQALKEVSREDFWKHCAPPPAIPTAPALCHKVTLMHKPIYIAGRYNKYSRELPQTPWVIAGERKLDSSVQEVISKPLEDLTKSQGVKFVASGREDVDVRTLGRGRPFTVELLDPKTVKLDDTTVRALERAINDAGRGKVAVRHLQIVNKDCLTHLKCGEEEKTKEYMALCVVEGPLPAALDSLAAMAPLVLSQSTPIRVLHRRPVAVRQRTVHWLKAQPISEADTPHGHSYFTVAMSTQAGTYIKEFIHGDFGRTTPSLGTLLGGTPVDILALDVQDIVLDWPPEIQYEKVENGD